jgi:hypothetical protein
MITNSNFSLHTIPTLPNARIKTVNASKQIPIPGFIIPKKPAGEVAPSGTTKTSQSSVRVSIEKLRDINKQVEISDSQPFIVTDKLKDMFGNAGLVGEDATTNAWVTTKPIPMGSGINLPIGTKITNSRDDRSTSKNGPINDLGVAENLKFTTPNGSYLKFTGGIDKKTALRTTIMEFGDAKSTHPKTVTFLGAPIFNTKTGVLTAASSYPSPYPDLQKSPTLSKDLMSRLENSIDIKRSGWDQATRSDLHRFLANMK